ncbi:BTB/POZ domain-containing proteinisoform X2 [Iris pallida]|uniref:BTB/POZ domain-containing proteinisoform X2 n=1 Tax=Iris pallida TaxID=29817 RepID=A0AAX6FY91_IRIPA|nr:BTB/POZ domain-containing proteinisoform X2 [Iris pallida]
MDQAFVHSRMLVFSSTASRHSSRETPQCSQDGLLDTSWLLRPSDRRRSEAPRGPRSTSLQSLSLAYSCEASRNCYTPNARNLRLSARYTPLKQLHPHTFRLLSVPRQEEGGSRTSAAPRRTFQGSGIRHHRDKLLTEKQGFRLRNLPSFPGTGTHNVVVRRSRL